MTFDALFEERQTTRAAARLAVAQSTVSGALARLRALFGDPLFLRRQGGMVPTPRAEQLSPRVKRLLAEARDALAPESFDPRTATFAAYISANDYGQKVVLTPLIDRLRRRAPGLRIGVMPFEVADLAEKFRRGQIDIAITIPEMAPQDYPSRFLFSDRYVGVVRPEHPVASERFDLDAFCAFPHIIVSPTGGALETPTDAALRRIGRQRRVVLSVPSFGFAMDQLHRDDAIAVLPELILSGRDRPLRTFGLPFDLKGPDAIMVWHPRIQEDRAFNWLREQIMETAREIAAGMRGAQPRGIG